MANLQPLRDELTRYQADVHLAKRLKDIKLNPAWADVIDKGFTEALTKEVVNKLATATPEERQQHLTTLTGISVFRDYLENIVTKGELAEQGVRETQDAIILLQQDN